MTTHVQSVAAATLHGDDVRRAARHHVDARWPAMRQPPTHQHEVLGYGRGAGDHERTRGERDVRRLVMCNHHRIATVHLHQRFHSSARVADARDLEPKRGEVASEQHRAGDVRAPAAIAIIEVGRQGPAAIVRRQAIRLASDRVADVMEHERVVDSATGILGAARGRDCRKKRRDRGEIEAHRAVA
jgi:hypothetical protein